VKDDDLDLELDDEPVRTERRPAPAVTVKPAPAKPVAPAKSAAPAAAAERKGWRAGLGGSVARVRQFKWNLRSFLCLLAVLIVLVVLVENWVPTRFYALGLAFEMPRTVMFVVDLVIGAALMWLWMRRSANGPEEES